MPEPDALLAELRSYMEPLPDVGFNLRTLLPAVIARLERAERVQAAAQRWEKADREYDADTNPMLKTCDHPHDFGNEFDAAVDDLRAALALDPLPPGRGIGAGPGEVRYNQRIVQEGPRDG